MSLYAWAASISPDDALALSARVPNLGLVLYSNNLSIAPSLKVPPIVYASNQLTVERVASMAKDGVKFKCVVFLDELNDDGPSGKFMPVEEYNDKLVRARSALAGLVPLYSMGLQPRGGFWAYALRNRKFDDSYYRKMERVDGSAFNPNQVRLEEVERVLYTYGGPWLFSPAPFRTWWDRLWEPMSVEEWTWLAKREGVDVALWCLREVHGGPWFGDRWQSEHGLFDREGNITNVGLEVVRALSK